MFDGLNKIDEYRWELPKTGAMRVPGLIFSDSKLMGDMRNDESIKQVCNVAQLPGILRYSLAMPDMHWGYGFPIGGVAAFDIKEGIISPGGVGYDINCGCRLIASSLSASDVMPKINDLVMALFKNIPSGVGSTGRTKLNIAEEKKVLAEGAKWAVNNGYGCASDLDRTEDYGCLQDAAPEVVSQRALERGKEQLGTLGSGNHFLEVDVVDQIIDQSTASAFGLWQNQVVVLLHSGSRGLGYQVCDDFLALLNKHVKTLDFSIPDAQLACAMIDSDMGRRYWAGMACAANYAWANRQMLMHWTRSAFEQVFRMGPQDLNMHLVYDVCHNIAKKEQHTVNGKKQWVCVHRKGATRAFPPGHEALPEIYRQIGQPVLVPGNMGTASYVMVGTQHAMQETFGSTCHGAGRIMSRTKALNASKGRSIHRELEDKGIIVKWTGKSTLREEMPDAYKDISNVVDVVHNADISRKVARLRPIGVIKG
ncbi:MAG: RtcB family protein [Pseudomonadota bacterium]